jgi:asparagine synthase (glutamine-hydrolysing)
VCGFVVVAGDTIDKKQFLEMKSAIKHRGPDGDGLLFFENIAMGHHRLSIVEKESQGQPWVNDGLFMVFNGEIYNHNILRTELEVLGCFFKSKGDTEVVFEAFATWGADAFSKLDGMFSVVFFDEKKQEVTAARDRFGIKPLYFSRYANGQYGWSSEIGAIKAYSKDEPWELSHVAIEHCLSVGYILEPHTCYEKVSQILPGHYERLNIDSGSIERVEFWSLAKAMHAPMEPISDEEGTELLRGAIVRQMDYNSPIGSFLSGGIDSSVISSVLSKESMGGTFNLTTYTAGFDHVDYDETMLAKDTATRLGVSNSSIVFDNKIVFQSDVMNSIYGGAYADNAALPTYFLSQLAKEKVKILYSGDGADELFFGYRNHRLMYAESICKKFIPRFVRGRVLGTVAKLYPDSPYMPRFLRGRSTLTSLNMDFIGSYHSAMSVCHTDIIRSILTPSFMAKVDGRGSCAVFKAVVAEFEHDDPMKLMQYLDFKTYLPGSVLQKLDRATMRAGIEARVPFLDNQLVSRVLPQTSGLNLGFGQHKTQLRKWAAPFVPSNVVNKVKVSFTSPLDLWFRNMGYDEVRRLLFSEWIIDGGVFDLRGLELLIANHCNGRANYGTLLNSIAVLSKSVQ